MILTYLIKSALCLLILLIFYKIGLENKAMHQFKRFYLLTSLVFAFTIPLVTFTYTIEVPVQPSVQTYNITQPNVLEQPLILKEEMNYWPIILWSMYGIGALIFGIRFILNLVRLKRKITRAQHLVENDFTLALLGKAMVPHSFLKWIFLNRSEYLKQKIAPEVIAHEATHVRQKHSWDILFIEVLQVIFWFNPLIWFSKSFIKLNHEFLADQGAINNKSNIAIYQNILLSYASSTHHTALESPFNYSLTKKRIVMLSQSFSKKKVLLRVLLLLPVFGICILLFNQGIVAQASNSLMSTKQTEDVLELTLTSNGSFFHQDVEISEKEIDSLISLNHITSASILIKKGIPEEVVKEKSDRLSKIASKSKKQFCINFIREEPLIQDIKPRKPSQVDFARWQNTSLFSLHVDGQRIPNEKIFSYQEEDLVHFEVGERISNAYLVDVWTRDYLNETNYQRKNRALTNQHENYATQFIKGAQRNGKKAIVIEVKNDSLYINGKYTELRDLKERIDNVTANWTKEEYAGSVRSIIFKGNSAAFIERAESEFRKTKVYKTNKNAWLIPPPPPPLVPSSPESQEVPPPPPPPVSPVKHLKAMKSLGGLFFYENKPIPYERAVELVKTQPTLSIKTPYPYSNPPKTMLSREPN